MGNLEVITRDTFQHRRWESPKNYKFAAQDTLCPLSPSEAPRAALHLPIAFAVINEQLTLVAVQGFEANRNYFVDNTGRWIGGYIPSPYRAYPFFIAKVSDQEALCFDTDSKLIDSNNADNLFFEEDGTPAKKISEILEFLGQVSESNKKLPALLALLERLELLEDWPIVLNDKESTIKVEGLLRVNEKRLNALSAEDLQLLQEQGAFALIYTQLVSMQNIHRLASLAQTVDSNSALPQELDFDLSSDSGSISFSSL